MIIMRMIGGLGNQMFMYAFSRQLQQKTGERIFASMYQYRHMQEGFTRRNYALNNFVADKYITVLPIWADVIVEIIYNIKKIVQKKKYNTNIIKDDESFIISSKQGIYSSEDMFRYYAAYDTRAKLKIIDGYFMSWRYFDRISKRIKKDFKFTTNPSKENERMAGEIQNTNAVCMHIRLGDYLSMQFRYSNYICKEEYFLKAMDLIANKIENPVFYIFSTGARDIEYIKKNYSFKYLVKYINLDNPDYEELRLMTMCKHFILSNSSFSWWAQYLCENKEKIIVAPSKWIKNGNMHSREIYLPYWNIIQV